MRDLTFSEFTEVNKAELAVIYKKLDIDQDSLYDTYVMAEHIFISDKVDYPELLWSVPDEPEEDLDVPVWAILLLLALLTTMYMSVHYLSKVPQP